MELQNSKYIRVNISYSPNFMKTQPLADSLDISFQKAGQFHRTTRCC